MVKTVAVKETNLQENFVQPRFLRNIKNEEETRQLSCYPEHSDCLFLEHGTDDQDIYLREQTEIKRSLFEMVTSMEMGLANAQADQGFRGLSADTAIINRGSLKSVTTLNVLRTAMTVISVSCSTFFFSIRHLQPFMSLSRLILEIPRSHTRTHHSR